MKHKSLGVLDAFIVRRSMEVPMRRFAVLFLVAAAGCNTSTTPQVDKGQKGTPKSKPASVESKSEHDYRGWKEYAPSEAAFEVRFPREPTVKTSRIEADRHEATVLVPYLTEHGHEQRTHDGQ
jgi:hypothetical protein